MKIHFKKKRLRANLLLGLIWIAFGVFSIEANDPVRWTDYGYMVIGLLYLGQYGHDRYLHYLTIADGTIRKNGLNGLGKAVSLNEVVWIKKFAGDLTLKTASRDLKIDTDLIDPESLEALYRVLSELDLPAEKTPFQKSA